MFFKRLHNFPGLPSCAALAAACLCWTACPAPLDPGTSAEKSQDAAAQVTVPACRLPAAEDEGIIPEPRPQSLSVRSGRIRSGEPLAAALTRLGLSGGQASEVIRALDGIFDFRRSRPGDQIRITFEDGIPAAVEYRASMTREWLVLRGEDGRLRGRERRITTTTEVAQVDIAIDSSLYEAMRAAGEDPSLSIDVADVFAWDIDFYRDVRRGDRLRLIVEKERVQGQLLRYGDIIGVRYIGGLVGDKTYLRYKLADGGEGYFAADGQSAKKAFLKSPLKYTFITSSYGGRQHPILGFHKKHQGVDLRAAEGTPVWSVADGTVVKAVKNDRGAGNYLVLRHANGMETYYMHLSKFADGIRPGLRVQQKQIVAYSGNTGRSTGPHLHYGMKRGGVFVDPMSQNFPRAKPLPAGELDRFRAQTESAARQLAELDDTAPFPAQ